MKIVQGHINVKG